MWKRSMWENQWYTNFKGKVGQLGVSIWGVLTRHLRCPSLLDNKSQRLHKWYSCYQSYYQREQWRNSHLSHDLIWCYIQGLAPDTFTQQDTGKGCRTTVERFRIVSNERLFPIKAKRLGYLPFEGLQNNACCSLWFPQELPLTDGPIDSR